MLSADWRVPCDNNRNSHILELESEGDTPMLQRLMLLHFLHIHAVAIHQVSPDVVVGHATLMAPVALLLASVQDRNGGYSLHPGP